MRLNDNITRLIQINTHSYKSLDASSSIMKTAIVVGSLLLFLAILTNSRVIPSYFEYFLRPAKLFIIFVAICIIAFKSYDTSIRNNLNYDKYDWKFNKPSTNTLDAELGEGKVEETVDSPNSSIANSFGFGCIDEDCCNDGQSYDDELAKCINNEDSFIGSNNKKNGGSSSLSFARKDDSYNIL